MHSLSLSLTLTQCAHYPSHSQRHSVLTIPLTHIVCSFFLLFITIKYAHKMTQCTHSHKDSAFTLFPTLDIVHSPSLSLTKTACSLPFSLLIQYAHHPSRSHWNTTPTTPLILDIVCSHPSQSWDNMFTIHLTHTDIVRSPSISFTLTQCTHYPYCSQHQYDYYLSPVHSQSL